MLRRQADESAATRRRARARRRGAGRAAPAARRSVCADRHARVQRRVRILEDRSACARRWARRPRRPVSIRSRPSNAQRARGRLDQAQHQAAQRRLAAARFADHAQRLAAPRSQIDAIDRTHLAGTRPKKAAAHREVLDQACACSSGARTPRWRRLVMPRFHAGMPTARRVQRRLDSRPTGAAARPVAAAGAARAARRIGERAAGRQSCSPAAAHRARHLAVDRRQPRAARASSRGIEPSKPDRVRMLRLFEQACDRARSTTRPAYITTTSSATSATTPRSCVISMIAVPVSCCSAAHQLEDLRLDRHVERGGRLVGDQQARLAGQRHRDHHALAHAAAKLVRIFVEALLRRRDAHLAQHLDGPRWRACARLMRRCRSRPSTICSPIVNAGFSDDIGSWKIIAMPLPRRSCSASLGAPTSSCPRTGSSRRRRGPGAWAPGP